MTNKPEYDAEIVKRGGDARRKKNEQMCAWLDEIYNDLSQHARDVISQTDGASIYECFGFLDTAEEINQYVEENYPDDDDE